MVVVMVVEVEVEVEVEVVVVVVEIVVVCSSRSRCSSTGMLFVSQTKGAIRMTCLQLGWNSGHPENM